MKKLLKCFSLAAAALMLFAGCSGLAGSDATVNSENYEGICSLAISVKTEGSENATASVNSLTKSVGAARTISPESLKGHEEDLVFTLKGTSVTTGATLGTDGAGFVLGGAKAPAGTGDNAGKYMAEIPYGAWELTLEAKDSTGKLALMGKSYANLKTSRSEIVFTLTTEGVTTPGGVSLSGSYTDAEGAAKSYKAGLYDLITGELKYPATETTANTTDAKTFAFSATSVLPGRYSFQIRFYNDVVAKQADENTNIVGYYEEIVVVAPARTTLKTTVDCGKINQKPTAPTQLRAYLKTDSEEADGYTVVLTWADNSSNEENFIITIKDYSTVATGEVYKVLGVEAADPADTDDKREVFYGSSMNAGGSLRASSETVSIKLPYGKLFDFEIQAQNFVGKSEITTTSARVTEAAAGAPAGATLIAAARVNRFAIDYFLNGGSLSLSGEDYTGSNYIAYASIYDYEDNTAKNLKTVLNGKLAINNEGAAASSNHLLKGTSKFVDWVKTDGTAIAATDLITFEGITVKATYDDSTAVSYSIDDDYYEITATAYYDNGTDSVNNTTVNVFDNKTFTIKAAISGTVPATLTIKSMKVKITGPRGSTVVNSSNINGTAPEFTWNVAEAESGIYTVSVSVKLSDNKDYEMSFNLDLER